MPQPPDNWLELDEFAVFGLGRSGRAAANLLARRGKSVVASDTRSKADFGGVLDELDSGVRRIFGRNEHAGADAVVLSPGIEPTSRTVKRLEATDCWVLSEIDLAFDASEATVVGITGTDGKTTTTRICGAMFEAADRDVAVAGNIGTPLCEAVASSPDWVVAEISAFQLWSSRHFEPTASGFTNIGGDHLDYFEDWAEYVQAKQRLLELTSPDGAVVLNADDDRLVRWAGQVPPRSLVAYSTVEPPEGVDRSLWSDDVALYCSENEEGERLCERADWSLPGQHNVANALCAAGLALEAGIEVGQIAAALSKFEPLPHRIEPVGQLDGMKIYNDSKATNVQAAVAGLECVETPYVAIVGGVDKGLELSPLVRALDAGACGLVFIGEVADRLERAWQNEVNGGDERPVVRTDSLETAVSRAVQIGRAEDARALTLSPAASSFDMFDSYQHRGEQFRAVVESSGAR